MKDVPTELAPEFDLVAIMKRDDARDAFISIHHNRVGSLPKGARVGTSSLRRQCQLKALRPDLDIVPLRGNVDTRLKKLESGEYDAIILAAAGVHRLGLHKHLRYHIPVEEMCPAVGQGALAIEIRRGDEQTRNLVEFLDHRATRREVECERALLGRLGGGCQVPIGARSTADDPGELWLTAMVGQPDGSEILRDLQAGPSSEPVKLGRRVAERLLNRGADRILADVYNQKVSVPKQP